MAEPTRLQGAFDPMDTVVAVRHALLADMRKSIQGGGSPYFQEMCKSGEVSDDEIVRIEVDPCHALVLNTADGEIRVNFISTYLGGLKISVLSKNELFTEVSMEIPAIHLEGMFSDGRVRADKILSVIFTAIRY